MNKTIQILRAGLIAVAVLLAAACSTGGGTKKGGGSAGVDARAVQRWEHLIAKRGGDAYEYLTPGYRETHPKDVYAATMSNRPVHWKEVKFQGKECADENSCVVHLLITYDLRMTAAIPGPVTGFSGQTENWIRIKGVWYYLPSE